MTAFEEIFSKFAPLITVKGKSYDLIKKSVLYSLIANSIKSNIIKIGDFYEDPRINILIPMRSGEGKTEIKTFIEKTIEGMGRDVVSSPIISNMEQFVGTGKVMKKTGEVLHIYGHLADDYLIFDEALPIFVDKEYREGRRRIRIALDPYKRNKIYKRLTEIGRNDAISYYPNCTVAFFLPPDSQEIEEHVVREGIFRRVVVPFVNISEEERFNALKTRFDEQNEEKVFAEWISLLSKLASKKFEWTTSRKCQDLTAEKTGDLIRYGIDRGRVSADFTEIMFFTLQNTLIKMAVVHAALDFRNEITVDDVENAYKDLEMFWKAQLNFITRHTREPKMYAGLTDRHIKCLKLLYDRGAFDITTSTISAGEFFELISKEFGITKEYARIHYAKRLKDMGLICSKKVSLTESRVWIENKDIAKMLVERFR